MDSKSSPPSHFSMTWWDHRALLLPDEYSRRIGIWCPQKKRDTGQCWGDLIASNSVSRSGLMSNMFDGSNGDQQCSFVITNLIGL